MSDTETSSSSSTMIVALVAIVVIAAVGFLIYRDMSGGAVASEPNTVQVNTPLGSAGNQ